MDPGRYAPQQGWDSNSALEGYGAVKKPDFRTGGSYSGRRNLDEGFPNESVYQRGGVHHDILDRDYHTPPPGSGIWSQSRRGIEEEYGVIRESRRHERNYPGTYHERDNFREADMFHDNFHDADSYNEGDSYHTYGLDRPSRPGRRESDAYGNDSYEQRHRSSRRSKERSHDADHDFSRYNCDSDYERTRRENGWRRHDSRDMERDKRSMSYEKDPSPHRRWVPSRSRSRGRDDRSRSRSPRGCGHDRSRREDSYDDSRYDRSEKWRDRDYEDRRHFESVGPSATVVVKGLSQKTTEDDLYTILADWGPLRHVRVIRERNSGMSRGFAFIDFPSVGAASNMIDAIGDDGLVFDGRKIFFEYSSKPTGVGAPGQENFAKSSHFRGNMPSDWMCTICGCINFARRTSCFQCNEGRTDDAPNADAASGNLNVGNKGSDVGPTHVLVVRGLDENADDEILRYEFAKHAPIKDIRLVRDKFTHVSRGFAFVHFHSVDDAKKALEATNGTKLDKNGNALRVAFARSIHGSGTQGALQSSSLAAAAIEAATFAQQYDAVGWAPKEYSSDASGLDRNQETNQKSDSVLQSGFVWDEKSGYYYDAASGFYYDGNSGLYYDGNSGTWFSYDQQNQQYVPCTDQNDGKESGKSPDNSTKSIDEPSKRKSVISAPAATISSKEKISLPDTVQAAAAAALAAEKKAKEKSKEIKIASKSSILANKKKMSNVLTMWKQRNHEGQTTRVVLKESQMNDSADDGATCLSLKSRYNPDSSTAKESTFGGSGFSSPALRHGTTDSSQIPVASQGTAESQLTPKPIGSSSGGSLMGVIRSSGRGIVKSDTNFSSAVPVSISKTVTTNVGATPAAMPFRTDASALGSYAPSPASATGKRRFSEKPVQPASKEQPQSIYRDRAAERRGLYGSYSSATTGDLSDIGIGESNREFSYRRGSSSEVGAMPFPPGVGGGHVASDARSYEVMTADRAIDENNVGNKMLRNMGWQEGSGLGKDGSGITEPVQAQGMEERAGLGRHQRKVVDPDLEVQAGDSYRTLIQKKAIARFREMT